MTKKSMVTLATIILASITFWLCNSAKDNNPQGKSFWVSINEPPEGVDKSSLNITPSQKWATLNLNQGNLTGNVLVIDLAYAPMPKKDAAAITTDLECYTPIQADEVIGKVVCMNGPTISLKGSHVKQTCSASENPSSVVVQPKESINIPNCSTVEVTTTKWVHPFKVSVESI